MATVAGGGAVKAEFLRIEEIAWGREEQESEP